MKLLFENWRDYLNERIDSLPRKKEEPWDIGETFPQVTKLDIIENPSQNIHQKNTLLDFFEKLEEADDKKEINSILKAMYAYSGNSEDFKYKTKDGARQDYLDPYRHGGKSLRDYHRRIKEIVADLTRYRDPLQWGE
jgi:hypothetical protein|tara:strand:- start:202 stop:612 length:411 start_codon:yes stop_codon:yes gene_type:complete